MEEDNNVRVALGKIEVSMAALSSKMDDFIAVQRGCNDRHTDDIDTLKTNQAAILQQLKSSTGVLGVMSFVLSAIAAAIGAMIN